MIYQPEQQRVTLAIKEGPYPLTTMTIWNLCTANAEFDTGIVKLDRQELAELCGVTPSNVSRSMKLLASYRAVIIERHRGRPVYRCHPLVGWCGPRVSELQRATHYAKQLVDEYADQMQRAPELDLEGTA